MFFAHVTHKFISLNSVHNFLFSCSPRLARKLVLPNYLNISPKFMAQLYYHFTKWAENERVRYF